MMFYETNGMCPYVKEMLREAKRQAFVKSQRKELRQVIDHAFESVDDPKKDYWSGRISAHLNRRLQRHTKDRWVPFVAEFNDDAAYGRIKQEKMKKYLLMTRDAAAEAVRASKRSSLVS